VAYKDPSELASAAKSHQHKAQGDDIQTWSVSEVDNKGKKKKGTLGVGNGSIFFASESDKVRSSHFPNICCLKTSFYLDPSSTIPFINPIRRCG